MSILVEDPIESSNGRVEGDHRPTFELRIVTFPLNNLESERNKIRSCCCTSSNGALCAVSGAGYDGASRYG
jgi:hypothetical protein